MLRGTAEVVAYAEFESLALRSQRKYSAAAVTCRRIPGKYSQFAISKNSETTADRPVQMALENASQLKKPLMMPGITNASTD